MQKKIRRYIVIILALVLTFLTLLPFMSAFPLAADGTRVLDDEHWTFTSGTTASMYTLNDDGSLAISYRHAGFFTARCAVLFDTTPYGDNYDVSFNVRLPKKTKDINQGGAAFAVGCKKHWNDGFSVVINDESNDFNSSNIVLWLFDSLLTNNNFDSLEGMNSGDAKISPTGWNDVKIEIRAGVVTLYINQVKITEKTMASDGKMLALGTNFDSGDSDTSKMTTYKNFKITTVDGSKSYEAFSPGSGTGSKVENDPLSSKWTIIKPMSGAESFNNAKVSVEDDKFVFKVTGIGPHTGIQFADAVPVDGLEIVFNYIPFDTSLKYCFFAITLSSKPLDDFFLAGVLGSRVSPKCPGKALSFTFFSDGSVNMTVNHNGVDQDAISGAKANTDTTVSFQVTKNGLTAKVNGQDVQLVVTDKETGATIKEDFIIKSLDYMVKGKSYLSFFAVGKETYGCKNITIKTINGVAPNAFSVKADSCDSGSHSFGKWKRTKAPTCTEKGEETRTCSVCGKTETRSVAAKGHTFGEWATTIEATEEHAGEESRTCSVCGHVETRTIPKKAAASSAVSENSSSASSTTPPSSAAENSSAVSSVPASSNPAPSTPESSVPASSDVSEPESQTPSEPAETSVPTESSQTIVVPDPPESDNLPIIIVAAALCGVLLGAGAILLLNLLKKKK